MRATFSPVPLDHARSRRATGPLPAELDPVYVGLPDDEPAVLLLLEPDDEARDLVRSVAAQMPALRLLEVQTAADALTVLHEETIHLALIDVSLPGGRCHEVLAALQREQRGAVAVVATRAPRLEDAVRALRFDALDFLQKPFDGPEAVRHALEAALRSWRLRRERHLLVERLASTVAELKQTNAELRTARASLARSEMLATVGRLGMGLMHHINSPLNCIVANLEFVRGQALAELLGGCADRSEVASEVGECFAEIDEQIQRLQRILERLRCFSSPTRARVTPVDLRRVVTTALAMLESGGSAEGTVLDLQSGAVVRGDAAQLTQVVTNLLANAWQAVEGRFGAVRVEVRRAGEHVHLVVRDDGGGMSAEVKAHAFDPFFTTRPVGSGDGLGLSICHGIVQEHGGDIRLESAPGRGTAVTVRLPAVPASVRGSSVERFGQI